MTHAMATRSHLVRLALPPLLLATWATVLSAQGTQLLEFADTGKAIRWEGDVPSARWAQNGRHVLLQDGKAMRRLDPVTGEAEPGDEPPVAATGTRKVALVADGDVWLDEVADTGEARGGRKSPRLGRGPKRSAQAVQLTRDGAATGSKAEAYVSPDARHVSFVRGNNLVVLTAAGGEAAGGEWRVTADGGPERFCGVLDWVYQEELYGRGNFQGHWWSPDGAQIAFLVLDESQVREFTVTNHVPDGFLDTERTVTTEVTNYPKVGDPNPGAALAIARLADRAVVPVDLSAFPADALVVRVEWTPDGSQLLAVIQDRIQTWAALCAIDPATGKPTPWLRETSPTWVNRPESPRWLEDGTFLWLSERTGYQHVYRYERGGKLLGAITSGEWQVRSIVRIDEAARVLWFEGTKDGAAGRHLYRIGFDGRDLVCVSPGIGTHQTDLSPDGRFVLDRWSAMDQPTRLRVLAADGTVLRELAQADKGAASQYAFSERQRVTVTARDGYELDACVMLPLDWQEGRRYPVYLPTYSGPDAPTVRDAWQHSTYSQFLAQQGFVVLQVNVRSASGRGQVHTGTCYKQLGVQELKDLEDAVDFVCAKWGGDPARVAISGWSYGGFMTAYALTHSTKFALGLAGAGVHDWRLYDTIYTERYMGSLEGNRSGYDATSVVKSAKNLHGHLVLLHGTMDDNVHMQNTLQLAWALQSAGVQDFEMMLYPRSRHGLDPRVGGHSQEFQWLRLKGLAGVKREL